MKMKKLMMKSFVLLFCLSILSCKDDDSPIPTTPSGPDFTVTTHETGHPEITEGQVFTFNTYGDPATAELGFDINNKTSTVSHYRVITEEFVNSTGWDFELCFGLCYPGISTGTMYPTSDGGTVVTVQPGESQTSVGNHFLNKNPGDGIQTQEWNFRFIQCDADGNEIAGAESLSLTYKYVPLT